jgi:hypothetical protein
VDWNTAARLSQDAFREAVNEWIGKARIQGGRIQATDAVLTPGSLTSESNLQDGVFQRLVRAKVAAPVAVALSAALAAAWNEWAAGFQMHLPGAYPTFAAVPAPYAQAPSASMAPLTQGSSPGEMALKAPVLARRLITSVKPHARMLGAGSPDQSMTALATWVDASFDEWKRVVRIGGLMGKGTVPTYAPPYVPVGPVVMGDNASVGPAFVGPRFGKLTL